MAMHKIFIFLLSWSLFSQADSLKSDPSLSLDQTKDDAFQITTSTSDLLTIAIMVKNEASVIVPTLQPFIDAGITHFLMFDTGSTDGTQDKARQLFEKYSLTHAYVLEEPFIDFATSRNKALDHAESLFPEIPFILMLDAEWYMHGVKDLLEFCKREILTPIASYLVPLYMIGSCNGEETKTLYYTARLIKAGKKVRFEGAVHEVIPAYVKVPGTAYVDYRPKTKGLEQTRMRWHRDKDLLLKSHLEDPTNPRTLFYLAQTYGCLGEWKNAYEFYKKRSCVQGWDEENYLTLYRLADAIENLVREKKEGEVVESPVEWYLQAYSKRSWRAEPLIKLAQYYFNQNNMPLTFLFAFQAVKIPYPLHDVLQVEDEAYSFTRYDLLAVSAWYTEQLKLGHWAAQKALEAHPHDKRVKRNLKFYEDKINPPAPIVLSQPIL